MLTPDCYMIDRRILLEAQTLVKQGHKVRILAGFECPKEEHYVEKGVFIDRYQYDWDDELLKVIREMLPANDKIRMFVNRVYMYLARRYSAISPFERFMIARALEHEADVYHVHDLPCLKAGWHAAKARKVPLVYDAHELYYAQDVLPPKLQKRYFELEKAYIKYPQAVITVNPFIGKLMAERYGIPIPEIIMNCTELPPDFQYGNSLLREKADLPDNAKIVLYQGWLSAERNIDTIIQGVKWFPENTYLVIIGYGQHEAKLREIASQAEIEGKVRFIGQVPSDEMVHYSTGANLGVIPYLPIDDNHRYCSPNKFFEFVIAGVPIISHELSFFTTMKEEYSVVQTTNMESAEAFGRTVCQLISDSELLRQMKANCLEAAQQLNWEQEGKKLLRVYNRLVHSVNN